MNGEPTLRGQVKPRVLWEEQRSLAFIMEQKGAMGDLAFAQEYLCKVMDDDSAAYPRAHTRKNLDMNVGVSFSKDHGGRYVVGFDQHTVWDRTIRLP